MVELADTPTGLVGEECRDTLLVGSSPTPTAKPLNLNKMKDEKEKDVDTTWDAWLEDMSDREQPEACSIDNPDCENCGS